MTYFAKLRKRALEALIDYTIIYTTTFVYIFTFGEPDAEGVYALEGFAALPVFGLWLVYFPMLEGMTGQTFGKKVMGIRVVKLNGDPVGFRDALVRRLFDMVDLLFFGLVGILVMRRNDKKQRVGDLVAHTLVIENRPVICAQCRESLTLDQHEFETGVFRCPNCKHQNHFHFHA